MGCIDRKRENAATGCHGRSPRLHRSSVQVPCYSCQRFSLTTKKYGRTANASIASALNDNSDTPVLALRSGGSVSETTLKHWKHMLTYGKPSGSSPGRSLEFNIPKTAKLSSRQFSPLCMVFSVSVGRVGVGPNPPYSDSSTIITPSVRRAHSRLLSYQTTCRRDLLVFDQNWPLQQCIVSSLGWPPRWLALMVRGSEPARRR
jgi:hypothetical protein